METQELARWIFGYSGTDAAPDLRGDASDYAPGSQNLLPEGAKQSRPFRGLTYFCKGSRLMFQIKDTFGGLDDVGANVAAGSLYAIIADALIYCGTGQVSIAGTDIPGAIATNVIRILLKFNGSYTDPKSGSYPLGLPKPEAVEVGTLSGDSYGATKLTGTVSVKYARLNKYTGDKSRASDTSAVLTVTNKAIYAAVPLPVFGQTDHIFFRTLQILGGQGLHYRMPIANPFTQAEYTEDDVQRTVTNLTADGTLYLNAPANTFSAGDVGKRINALSGFTVPSPTVVLEVVSDSRLKLSNPLTVTSGALEAELIAFAGATDRTVVLHGKDSDLVEETAWIYDYPPPTCSHAFQLENRNFVATYAESKNAAASASSANPGTALLPSIPNAFGSYDPRYPVYIPEKVVDILSDKMDSYKFIGGENGVYAIQYLNVTDAIPATLTVLLRGEGIKKPHNWCARESAIYLYTSEPVRIIEGGRVDKSFANKARPLMRGWTAENVVVSSTPKGAVYSHGSESLLFEEASGRWSAEINLRDFSNGSALSATSVGNRMIMTMNESGGVRRAYWFDEGAGSYVCGIGHYQNEPAPSRHKAIQFVRAEFVCDRTDRTVYFGIHANSLPTHVKDAAMSAGGSVLTSPSSRFTSEILGSYVLIRGAGASGGFLYGRIRQVISPTQIAIGTPAADLAQSAALAAQTTVTGAYSLIALRIFPIKANRSGTIETKSPEMFLSSVHSYAASLLIETDGTLAQPLEAELAGIVNMEEGMRLLDAAFGESL